MTAEEYADLMEKTDAELPSISDHFGEWDYEDTPGSTAETGEAAADWDGGVSGASVGEGTGEGVSAGDPGRDPGGANPDGGDSCGADPGGSDGGAGALPMMKTERRSKRVLQPGNKRSPAQLA